MRPDPTLFLTNLVCPESYSSTPFSPLVFVHPAHLCVLESRVHVQALLATSLKEFRGEFKSFVRLSELLYDRKYIIMTVRTLF